MKTFIFLLLLGSYDLVAMAQKSCDKFEKKIHDVPLCVKQAFMKDFPNIKKASWEFEDGDYEADFILNGIGTSASYDKTGHRTEIETIISPDQLPKQILKYINKYYSNYGIIEASKVVSTKKIVTYEIEMGNHNESFELVFDEKGNYLSREKGD